jgi:uncharacterized membrane protein YccC
MAALALGVVVLNVFQIFLGIRRGESVWLDSVVAVVFAVLAVWWVWRIPRARRAEHNNLAVAESAEGSEPGQT